MRVESEGTTQTGDVAVYDLGLKAERLLGQL